MIRIIAWILSLVCFACQPSHQNQTVEFTQSDQVQLAKPIVEIDSIFFRNSAQVKMGFRFEGAETMYSWNQNAFQKYEEVIQLKKSGILFAKNVKKDFIESELVHLSVIKVNTFLDEAGIKITPEANENYSGQGNTTLIDQIKGSFNFRDGNWCGFQDSLIHINLELKESKKIEKVFISTLTDITSSIFKPISLELYINGEKIKEQQWSAEKNLGVKEYNIIPLSFMPTSAKSISLKIGNMTEVPKWHPNRGAKPWIFIDEIIVE